MTDIRYLELLGQGEFCSHNRLVVLENIFGQIAFDHMHRNVLVEFSQASLRDYGTRFTNIFWAKIKLHTTIFESVLLTSPSNGTTIPGQTSQTASQLQDHIE
jgi:hypothetical protein